MLRIAKYVKNPLLAYAWANAKHLMDFVPDETHLKLLHRAILGERLDLGNPRTFSEKLQWLKLYDRNPLYTTLVDKHAVKSWVAERIGDEHIVKTLATWHNSDDITLDDLPNRFVLKTNHDCGGVVVCKDKRTFDLPAAKRLLKRHLDRNYYYISREWPYKNVRPLVFAEEYLEDAEGGGLTDYKLYRFNNGRIVTLVCEDRFSGNGFKKTYFDEEWRFMELHEGGYAANPLHPAPRHFREMKEMANILADGMPFCRVDFFEANGRCYFGEMTFYAAGGFCLFDPAEWNEIFGSWIDLTTLKER